MAWEEILEKPPYYTPPRILANMIDGFLARKLLSCAKPFSSASAPTKIHLPSDATRSLP